MLGNFDAIPTVAVKDLKKARKFYEDKLGLEPVDAEGEEVLVFRSGENTLLVYVSEFAGTNKATAVTWTVEDVGDAVKGLKAKGVKFEHYDMPGMTLDGDVHRGGDMAIAWFKDPDGNILAVVN